MVNLKRLADMCKSLAVHSRPVGFDTEAVGDLPADVIDQPLQRMKPTLGRMGHRVYLGVSKIIEMVADILLIGLRKPRCIAVNQQSEHDLACALRLLGARLVPVVTGDLACLSRM